MTMLEIEYNMSLTRKFGVVINGMAEVVVVSRKTVIFLTALMMLLITSCGTKTDNGTSEETKKNATEDRTSNQTLSETENKTDTIEKTETAYMKFDESKVKSVVIADGNTGDRVEFEEADMKEILQKLNDMEFVNIDSEAYTGWTYSIKITYEDGSVMDITITGNEKIKCVKGNDVKYYKTEEDIIKLVDNYYKEQ